LPVKVIQFDNVVANQCYTTAPACQPTILAMPFGAAVAHAFHPQGSHPQIAQMDADWL
jgi:hypothetical protein